MAIKTFNQETQQWEICASSQALETQIIDVGDNFDSNNVEGALRELAEDISRVSSDFEEHKVNHPSGSGGGGSALPTITSTFEGGIVEEGSNVIIDVFFSSPNLGDGIAYVLIDGIETYIQTVKQGNNKINAGVMPKLRNNVSIYVTDRAGLTSNQLSWSIISGGISLSIDFDYDVDYSIDDVIKMPYTITTESIEPIYLNLTIDNVQYTYDALNGYNEYTFKNLGVGVHTVTVSASTGSYTSKSHNFNIVIVNSHSLYLSSTFNETEFEYGVPININYRISKLSSESFSVRQLIDGNLSKELSLPIGSYYWTVNKLPLGNHKLEIEVSSSSGEYQKLSFAVNVTNGSYIPVQPVQQGLMAWFDASDRTNNDIDRDVWVDKSGNNVKATLHNFNYSTNGWVNGSLNCDGKAYVEIDLKPYKDNVKQGSTIDILYKPINIGLEDAKILDYTDVTAPYKGISINLLEATLTSMANKGTVGLDEGEETRLTFVIDRNNKFAKIYVNAVLCRAFYLSDTGAGVNKVYEDFTHDQKIYLNSKKGISDFGACEIKNLRVYSRALNHEEVLQNHIADISNLEEQKELYKFNYENTSTPVIRMYGNTANMTGDVAVPMRVRYVSPNEELYGQSFDLNYCQVRWQGTSSLQYVLKNYSIIFKDDNMADYYYTPFRNGIKENILCLKADYMESSHANNVGLAKFINDCLYDTKNPAQLRNDKVRNAVNGFPVLLYINDVLQGSYNFNLDRYSTNSYGYDQELFPKCICYEVSANSDSTAGAFHKWTPGSGKTELDYLASDFEAVFPPDRRAGNDTFDEIKRLVDWVNDADDELFKEQIDLYFNKEYLLRYYLVVMIFGLVDNLGKNMKLTSWDGLVWYPQFYDLDTALGLDNTGFLKFDMDIEVEPGIFNTSGSNLWSKVARVFESELKAQYSAMRQDRFTVENIMKYVYGEQVSQIPQINYNKDMQTKYLDFGPQYLYACHGNRYQHMKRWIKERLIYVDTLMEYNVSTSDYITIRANKQGPVFLDLQTYIPMYLRVKWRDEANNSGVQVKRVARGEKVRFEYNMPTATDQEVIIYAGQYLKDIGDVSNLQPTTMLIGNAPKLTKVKCSSPNLINMDLSQCYNLQEIDISGCTKLGSGIGSQPTLNVQACKYLRKIDFRDTQLTAIYTNQNGGNLEEIYYPLSIQTVELRNLLMLKTVDIPVGSNLATLTIVNCENLKTLRGDSSLDNSEILNNVQHIFLQKSMNHLTRLDIVPLKLQTLAVKNMFNLEHVRIGGNTDITMTAPGILTSIDFDNCPNVKIVEFSIYNKDSLNNKWEQSLNYPRLNVKDGFILDLSKLTGLIEFRDRILVQGINKLYVPKQIERITICNGFDNSTSNNFSYSSTLTNIWCPQTCNHDEDFEGFDGAGLTLTDVMFTFLTNIKKAINMNLKFVKAIARYNLRRNAEIGYLSPEGTFDYSEYTGGINQEWERINDPEGKMNIIFPDFSKIYQINNLFRNSTMKISWDIANDIINSITSIDSGCSVSTFEGTKFEPFQRYSGIHIENLNVIGFTSAQSMFNSSNVNHIEKFKIKGVTDLGRTFKKLNLETSWDFANELVIDNSNIGSLWEAFANSELQPFNKYPGLILESESIINIESSFHTSNMNNISSINLPNLINMGTAFYKSTVEFENTWDIVLDILNNLPMLENASNAFAYCSMKKSIKGGIVIRHSNIINAEGMFNSSNLTSIKEVNLPNLTNANNMFSYLNNKEIIDTSWDVIIDMLNSSPLLTTLRHAFTDTKMQPQTKPISFDLPELINIEAAFARTNITELGEIKCPILKNMKNTFLDLNEKVHPEFPHRVLDIVTQCQDTIETLEGTMAYIKTTETLDKIYDINWTLPNVTNMSKFASHSISSDYTDRFRYQISKFHVSNENTNASPFYHQICDGPIMNVYSSAAEGTRLSFETAEIALCDLVDNVVMDNYLHMDYLFARFKKLKKITNSMLKPKNGQCMFNICNSLVSIDALDLSKLENASDMFSGCNMLEDIKLVGTINMNISFARCSKLNVETLVRILNALTDRTGVTPNTLNLGSTNISKLSSEQISIATAKNWILT